MFQLHAELRVIGLGYREADETTIPPQMERSLNRIERVAAVYFGEVINRLSNGLQIAFDTAEAAVLGACEMQHRCAALPQLTGTRLILNIGIHQGLHLKRLKDGPDSTIEIASLLADVADGIVTSEVVIAALHPELRKLARPLNGLSPQIAAHTIDWRHEIPSSAYGGNTIWPASRAVTNTGLHLILRYKLDVLRLSQEKPVLTIGRDLRNDLVLAGNHVSRNHCRIESREIGIVLSDSSSNGTFVIPDRSKALQAIQGDVVLIGKGMIFCGRKFDGERRGGVAYDVFN